MSISEMKKPDCYWLSPCGLSCDKCGIHLRTPEELAYWKSQNIDLDKIRCDGCRSSLDGNHWSPACKILVCCVYKKQLSYCAQCEEFPCETLQKWSAEHPHHADAVQRLHEMKDQGIVPWLEAHGYE